MSEKKIWMRLAFRGTLALLAALLLSSALAACSGSDDKADSDTAAQAPQAAAGAVASEEEASLSISFNREASYEMADTMSMADGNERANSGGESGEAEAPEEALSGTSGGGAVATDIGTIADPGAGFGRQVIYTANLVMKVEAFAPAEERLLNLIHLSGAYVLQFSDSRSGDNVGASYTIKVPSSGFSSFLSELQKIENLFFEREVQGKDVSEEFVDLASRLKAKQAVEARLLAFMDKARDSDDLVRFSNELGQVQQEIEEIKGRQRYLQQNVAFSTVNLRLYEGKSGVIQTENKAGKSIGVRIADALSGSANALGEIGEALLVALAAILPVAVVAAVVGVPAYLIVRSRRASRRDKSTALRRQWNAERSESAESGAVANDAGPAPFESRPAPAGVRSASADAHTAPADARAVPVESDKAPQQSPARKGDEDAASPTNDNKND